MINEQEPRLVQQRETGPSLTSLLEENSSFLQPRLLRLSEPGRTHRLVTEPLAALPPLSLPFNAAVEEAAAAAGSMFWEAMIASVAARRKRVGQRDRCTGRGHSRWLQRHKRNRPGSVSLQLNAAAARFIRLIHKLFKVKKKN